MKKVLCVRCKRDAYKHCYSEAGRCEVAISGLCEECFDEICASIEDEDEDSEED